MSDTFTASNEIELRINDGGWIERRNGGELGTGRWDEVSRINATGPSLLWDALREFVEHQRDKQLGRWRSTADPEWVVYENGHDAAVAIHEPSGVVHDLKRGHVFPEQDTLSKISEEYFDAHLEPKPWHAAEPDQVWSAVVDSTGGVRPLTVMEYVQEGRVFLDAYNEETYELTDPCITDAKQIWPEVKP